MENTIQTLGLSEAKTIGKIIADGFADDPVNLWAFNGTKAMQPVFTAMAHHLFLPKGFGHKTSDSKAGTLWLPPQEKKEYSLLATLKMASAILSHGGIKAINNTLKLDNFLKNQFPQEPHYYLFAISVHPSLQGKGIGSKLMRHTLEAVDTAKMPAYLESSKRENVPFYRNHGFEVMNEIIPAKGCPPMWLMKRTAQ